MSKEQFLEQLSELNINITKEQYEQIDKYYQLLVEWNEKINLTNITEKEEVYLKHFYDSLTLAKAYDLTKEITLCDIGTGAGFPGLVLKIVFPNLKIILVDSLTKRTIFLKEVINQLGLKNIEVEAARGEEYAANHRESFDIVTSRAVAKLNVLAEICIPMVKVNGYFIPMKANIEEELVNSKKSIQILDAIIEEIISFQLPIENSIRNLIKIKKNKKTNPKYPRQFQQIKKNPL